ncbi:MAG TPA: 7-cyano-7-deazaguanine synthase QueC [Myxococcaceae bacterium]|nr:7-cyano-7-deazaguanine synthase QueC [Myxococcaceae bacterium]
MSVRRAVVLLSGGLDSATCLALARSEGFRCSCLLVDYGQRHRVELERAKVVARAQGVEDLRVVQVDLRAFGGSALTADIPVPKDRGEAERGAGIPVTYVPARNTLFLSLALGMAEALGATDLFIGVNAVDYSGYPDCRPEFIRAFEGLANLATRAGVEGARFHVHAPLSGMRKAEIIRTGVRLGVDHGLTHSCYDPDAAGRACGRCDSCLIRREGFRSAGVPDPTPYAP